MISHLQKIVKLIINLTLILGLTACGTSPIVTAQERLFLPLTLEFLDEYQLPKTSFENTPVGGLSALSYDRKTKRFYAISDDKSQLAPARFYTLNLKLDQSDEGTVEIEKIDLEAVTFLKNEQSKTYEQETIDPEGIAISPRGTVFIASEGIPSQKINPFIGEFALKTGQFQQSLKIPQRYLPQSPNESELSVRGVRENLGFEALTLGISSTLKDDPFRLFTATETALLQDNLANSPQDNARIRLMHYVINSIGNPVLVAEHLYLLDPSSDDTLYHGLTELTALSREGFFLSLERTLSLSGFGAKIFQVVNANATDTSRLPTLPKNLNRVEPLKKKLLLDLSELDIDLDNLEGMTQRPRLRDGSQTLLLLSDDNFKEGQVTQFLLFRLIEK